MNISPLKYLLKVQNFFCIFRNFWSFKKSSRVLICIWIIVELAFLLLNIILNILLVDFSLFQDRTVYFFSMTGFSVPMILLPVYHSERFKHLMKNFTVFHLYFQDGTYSKILFKEQNRLTLMVALLCLSKFIILAYLQIRNHFSDPSVIATMIYHYSLTLCEFRFTVEYFVLHGILFAISEQLKAITKSIENELSIINRIKNENKNERFTSTLEDPLKKFELWMAAYKNISSSSTLFNTIFSTQLAVMQLIITIFSIIMLYTMATAVVNQVSVVSFYTSIISMVFFALVLYVVSRAGQRVYNSSITLRRKLCLLHILSVENEQYLKLTNDLLRYCCKRPVRVNLIGSLNIDMSLLPSCVAIITSNTIIGLQFNNVL